MQMKPEEIRRSYEKAARKEVQIGILAELNACPKEDIRKILIEQGIPEDELPKRRGRKKPDTAPVKKQKTERKTEIPMRVKSALYGAIKEKENQIENLILDKERAEKGIEVLQEDILEIRKFLGEEQKPEQEGGSQ